MSKDNLIKLTNLIFDYNFDGYVVPKNDSFFTEQVKHDRLRLISNFSGSAGLAIILRKKNYLFVDSRYTIQAKIESGKNFKIIKIHKKLPKDVFKNITLGYDPNLFTHSQLKFFFGERIKLKSLEINLVDEIFKIKKNQEQPFYSLPNNVTGASHKKKINLISNYIKRKKADFLYISAPENVAWLLNIRGTDTPFSPLPNCNLILSKNKRFYLIAEKHKIKKLLLENKLSLSQIIEKRNFEIFINNLKGTKFIVDNKTFSVLKENKIKRKFTIISRTDPCYLYKSRKNSVEIKNIIQSHIADGAALTKFIFWIKNLRKKKITEIDAEKKLEKLRKKNKKYLYPSFNTIAGTGANGAIVHYRSTKKTNRVIKKKDIFLCDSGGQYKYGTTDVTRTLCFAEQPNRIKDIFTLVLKGHIAVVTSNVEKENTGSKIDFHARKFLKKFNLDYGHGTGHGVGYFLNVHEGPQSISKFSNIKLEEGMILSNEPGYYEEGKFGIRIENLIYIKKEKKKLIFKNLTLAPIDKDLINYKLLTKPEKDYLFNYHLFVYSKISKFLSKNERKWLIKNL
tara:strand:+ start:728 stop:2425 length:1698 start_codon:yes stop_codon:yes gene_type:complete